MFAYCNNNPVRYVDSEGTEAELLEWWTGFMWWLCAIDGVLPFGDILYALGCVVLIIIGFAVVDEAKDSFSELEHESDENTQIEDAGVSAPATPPNGNRNNKNDKRNNGNERDYIKAKTNAKANNWARRVGAESAELLKSEFVGRDGSRFDMFLNRATNEIILINKSSGLIISTGYYLK